MNFVPSQTFPDAARQAETWVSELSEYLHCERQEAYDWLRAVLHSLRDSMTPTAAADLASHLPALIRRIFYEGWQPENRKPCRNRGAFIANVARNLENKHEFDVEQAVQNVFNLLERRLNSNITTTIKMAMNG